MFLSWFNRLFFKRIVFPYKQTIIGSRLYPYPEVDLVVRWGKKEQTIRFLVDSGADITTLPIDPFARFFGVNLSKKSKTRIEGVGKDHIDAYPGMLKIKIGGSFYRIRCLFVDSSFVPLLGRVDVWKYFSILFDNKDNRIVFNKI